MPLNIDMDIKMLKVQYTESKEENYKFQRVPFSFSLVQATATAVWPQAYLIFIKFNSVTHHRNTEDKNPHTKPVQMVCCVVLKADEHCM